MDWWAARRHLRQREKACLAVNEHIICCFTVLGLLSLAGTAACKQLFLLWLKGTAEWCRLQREGIRSVKCKMPNLPVIQELGPILLYCSIAGSRHSSGVTKTPNSSFSAVAGPPGMIYTLVLLNKINAFHYSRMEILKTIYCILLIKTFLAAL